MSSLKVILVYLGWALLWAIVLVFMLIQLGYTFKIALTDALVTSALVVGSSYAMGTAISFYQPGVKNLASLLAWSLGLAAICTAIYNWSIEQLLEEEVAYLAFADEAIPVRLAFTWLMISFVLLLNWLWFYIRGQQEAEERKIVTEKMAREAELFNLRQQLQPHFLFNSLNSISALVGGKPEKAREMIHQLSDFLRGTLRKDDQQLVPLADELKHLQLYLDIEKVRFGNRLQTAVTHDEESLRLQLPVLLLQPVVENAIKFGLYDTLDNTMITLEAAAERGVLVIKVRNPFDPATVHPRRGTGFGLNSIRRRLYLLYARQDLLQTEQHDSTFTTTLKIPQKL
ncbi:sensor histidine kinase [Pontibacter sp. SGAir0037]|uniref:sensor histidine kinase n=1 Tax=Pontibacter sp. SGAir0037 TaxID=2571030 RepID=UPI001F10FC26|nr:histidine kinase [Pontibacter sp. SGAir0037]